MEASGCGVWEQCWLVSSTFTRTNGRTLPCIGNLNRIYIFDPKNPTFGLLLTAYSESAPQSSPVAEPQTASAEMDNGRRTFTGRMRRILNLLLPILAIMVREADTYLLLNTVTYHL